MTSFERLYLKVSFNFLRRNEEIRIPEELEWVKRRLSERGSKVPLNFVQTAPSFDPTSKTKLENGAILQRNPQTVQFLELLDLKFPFEDQIPIPISFGIFLFLTFDVFFLKHFFCLL